MEKILNVSEEELDRLTRRIVPFDSGSEGDVYILNNKMVLKKFNDLVSPSDYDCNLLLKYSDIENESYYFTKNVFLVNGLIKAYTMKKCPGYNLTRINPLTISLNELLKAYTTFEKDTKSISDMHIKGYDMMFNFMYDGNRFGAIDTIHYYTSKEDSKNIFDSNICAFNNEVALLLVDGFFENFVKQDSNLHELYEMAIKNKAFNLTLFITLFKERLSEYCGKEVKYLDDARKALKISKTSYPRTMQYSVFIKK